MRFPPPSVRSQWPKPNYVNPERRGPSLIIIESIFLFLTVVIMLLRLYVRIFIIRKLWWDDCLMVGATIFTAGVTACVILATSDYGWDLHIWDLPYSMIAPSRKISIAGQTLFLCASSLTKLSILVSYLRIAVTRPFLRCIYISIAVICVWVVVFAIVLWTQCTPIRMYWTLSLDNRHCIAEGPPMMGQTILTIVTDILVYILPIRTLWRVSLPTTQRVGLMALFALGLFVCVAGIMRTYYAHFVIYKTYDVTWEGYNLWIWTALETDIGVIGGSIPSLKPLLFKPSSRHLSGYKISGVSGTYTQKRSAVEGKVEGNVDIALPPLSQPGPLPKTWSLTGASTSPRDPNELTITHDSLDVFDSDSEAQRVKSSRSSTSLSTLSPQSHPPDIV